MEQLRADLLGYFENRKMDRRQLIQALGLTAAIAFAESFGESGSAGSHRAISAERRACRA